MFILCNVPVQEIDLISLVLKFGKDYASLLGAIGTIVTAFIMMHIFRKQQQGKQEKHHRKQVLFSA
jgi:uncharacterized membrane protein YdjX (TVP38/TMEM64 family)